MLFVGLSLQYAHKLAYLVGQNIRKEPSHVLADRLFFLWAHLLITDKLTATINCHSGISVCAFFIFIVKSVLIASLTCSLKFQINILLAVFSVAIGGVDAVTTSIFLWCHTRIICSLSSASESWSGLPSVRMSFCSHKGWQFWECERLQYYLVGSR